MSWVTLTTDEVVEELNDREVTALNAVKGREALGGILDRVVARVRGSVYAGGTVLGDEGTIPASLAGDAVAMARWNFLISVARNEALQTKDRRDAKDKAEERLRLVETGELRIEPASGTTTSGTPSPSFETRTRTFTKQDQDGL